MSPLSLLRRAAAPLAALLGLAAGPGRAVPFVITYSDPPGFGFNDNTAYTKAPFSPSSPGTLGQARRSALEAVVSNWGDRLNGSVPITVDAAFEAMGGTANSATLAYAGPNYAVGFTLGNIPHLWLVAAHAAEVTGTDFAPGMAMIIARFNSDVDGPTVLGSLSFYYGTDGVTGGNVDFYQTTTHEFGHGIGFLSLVEDEQDTGTGVITPTGDYSLIGGVRAPSYFDFYMGQVSGGSLLPLTDMTLEQRKAALTSKALVFAGPKAAAANGGFVVPLYAPSPWEAGSSASHLDELTFRGTSANASVNEMMTPAIGPGITHSPGPVVTGILQDMEWSFTAYTMADAARALRLAGGLEESSNAAQARLNVVGYTAFPARVDMQDALKVARMAAGTEPNPNP